MADVLTTADHRGRVVNGRPGAVAVLALQASHSIHSVSVLSSRINRFTAVVVYILTKFYVIVKFRYIFVFGKQYFRMTDIENVELTAV